MKACSLLLLILVLAMISHASEKAVPTVERNGQLYVRASALSERGGIAIKLLPGGPQIVACSEDRCALLKEFVREPGDTLVAVEALTKALEATAEFSAGRREVRFHLGPKNGTALAEPFVRVGQLAQNFRLTKLDGTSLALSDLRGRRVVINSWASW